MKHPEHHIQSSFFEWLSYKPSLRPYIFSIPNGKFIGRVVGFKSPGKPIYQKYWGTLNNLKREGLTEGVPDVFCAIPSNGKHGLWIEFKAGKNKPSEAQKVLMDAFKNQGYAVAVCYSVEEAIECLQNYLYPAKEVASCQTLTMQ